MDISGCVHAAARRRRGAAGGHPHAAPAARVGQYGPLSPLARRRTVGAPAAPLSAVHLDRAPAETLEAGWLGASLLEHEALPPAPGVGHIGGGPLLGVNLELGHLLGGRQGAGCRKLVASSVHTCRHVRRDAGGACWWPWRHSTELLLHRRLSLRQTLSAEPCTPLPPPRLTSAVEVATSSAVMLGRDTSITRSRRMRMKLRAERKRESTTW